MSSTKEHKTTICFCACQVFSKPILMIYLCSKDGYAAYLESITSLCRIDFKMGNNIEKRISRTICTCSIVNAYLLFFCVDTDQSVQSNSVAFLEAF